MGKKRFFDVPVEKNQYIELEITGLNHDGHGVGRYQGFTLFVPNVIPGEIVKVKVIKVQKSYGVGRLIEVIKPSPHRVEPPCPVYYRCGGCQLQHMAYEEQLRQKRLLVVDSLVRIGGLRVAGFENDHGSQDELVVVHPTIGMDNPWQYRNKTQVPVGEQEGSLVTGFFAVRSHDIVPTESCAIQHENNDRAVQVIRRVGQELGISAYDEELHTGLLRHIVVRTGFRTGDVMVVLVINAPDLPEERQKERLVGALREEVPGLKSVMLNINRKRTNVIFGDEMKLLWGEEYIYDYIEDVKFAISARSFYQVNPVQTEKLYGKALEYAQLTGKETVIDAYCGVGTISLFLARHAGRVYGVEVVGDAVADARRNARLNGMENVEFAVGESEKVIPWWYAQGIRADVVVVDPPRKGCDPALLETIIKMRPQRVVYVSCNPSTLARDLRVLEDGGFRTVEVQPVDMFPQTGHVECVIGIQRIDT